MSKRFAWQLLVVGLIGVNHLLLGVSTGACQGRSADEKFTTFQIRFFENKVQPIIQDRCLKCHGDDSNELGGELALISRASILKGGESGPAVDLIDWRKSILLDAIHYGSYQMPPDGKLSDDEIGILTKWIEMKMPWPAETAGRMIESETKHDVPQVNSESKSFWSFKQVQRPDLPAVKREEWISNSIDRFILAKLESAGLSPAPTASKAVLIRRLYYDIIGLPPTPKQVEAFVNDDAPGAYRKLVEQLLASPHYGEKWGRHWLDIVRYAESNSFERDGTKPFVWRYRDYVIRSFNEDKPYDQFLIEQLAGDEIDEPTYQSIIATGYYRLGPWDDEPADPRLALYDDLDDILATTSQAMMGLTVNCARCHDHKIDPIPTKDYYQLLSFFRNVRRYGVRSRDSVRDASTRLLKKENPPSKEVVDRFYEQVTGRENAMKEVVDIVKQDFEPVEHEEFRYAENHERLIRKRLESKLITQKQFDHYIRNRDELRELITHPPDFDRVLCVKETGSETPSTRILIRGNPHIPGDEVEPGFISVLSPPEPTIEPRENSSGRRLALARWITSPEHPLTARVMANRIWQHHFGRGIVRTSNDFGFQGTKPTHQKLLDYLASEFVSGGWSMKNLHRTILLSSTYRMSNQFNRGAYQADPLNDLFWRFDMRRLTAEELRDSILAVSGRLNAKTMYGPSIFTRLSKEVLAGQSMPGNGWGNSPDAATRRRSIYIHVKRSLGVPLLQAFDAADTDTTCPVRFNTTQPTQALALINSEFANSEAIEFAKQIAASQNDLKPQVAEILSRVLQRDPTESEIAEGIDLIQAWIDQDGVRKDEALAFFCLSAFNLNEFIFLE